jgi:hypothetical protein
MIGGMGFDGHFARQQSSAANIRFGSKADIEASVPYVRFTPQSGHLKSLALRIVPAAKKTGA